MLKKLVMMGVILIGIIIVAAIAVPYFVPQDTIKLQILGKIEEMTGRKVTVGGQFKIRFFPFAGATLEDVTIPNLPSYGNLPPLMTLKSLDVNVAVISLLAGNVEIKKLVIDEPQINLHVGKDGVKNWLPPQPASPQPETKAAPSSSSSLHPVFISLPHNLLLGDVKINDGTIAYDDEAAKEQWTIKKLNIGLTLRDVTSPFTIDASGEWKDKPVQVKGTLDSLQTFLDQARTKVDASVESELLSLTAHGFIIDGIRYDGKAKVKSSSLKALLAWLNPAGTPLQTPAKLALDLSSDMDCTSFKCSLTNASLTLDNIQAKGNVKASSGETPGQLPQVDVQLSTGVLDFNPFMSEQHADAGNLLFADAHAETSGRWNDKPIDLSALKAVNGTATIAADGIVVNKITLGKTKLNAKLEDGRLSADIIDAIMYGGKGNIMLSINAAAAVPEFQKSASFKGVQVQPLFKDAADMSRLSGTADIDMNSASAGKSEKELVDHLAGNGQFKLTNGALEGVDLTNLIANKTSGGAQKTPITDMKGSFTIAQGVVSNRDLTLTSPTLNVTGQGSINLPVFTIDYRLTPQVVQAADKTGAAKEGIAVPVIVDGSLDKPDFRPDLKSVVGQALKDPKAFKDQLKNTRDSLKNGLGSPDGVKNLKNLLQGF